MDPNYFNRLQKEYLHDPVRTYEKKVGAMKRSLIWSEKFDWEPMSSKEHGVLGALLLRAVMSIPADADSKEGFFESRKVYQSRTKL